MPPNESIPQAAAAPRLSRTHKATYALGDHTVNLVLSAASLLFLNFLTDVAGLRPLLAGAVVWVARAIDAFTDPAMGRMSDLTTWKAGRRRPYFLIGAVPFGVCFTLMWLVVPFETQTAKFAYYAIVYVGVSLAMTCISVPYLALIPEMATDYDERTSLNTFRSAGAVLGTFAAVGMHSLAVWLGGDARGWLQAAVLFGVWLVVPWLAVHRVSFERPEFRRASVVGLREGVRILLAHRTYRSLASFYIFARIAVDLIGAMFLFYFASWIGRRADFDPTLALFLGIVVLSLPVWLRVAERFDKRSIFIFGTAWWAVAQIPIFLATPEWPRWLMFAIAGLAAIGYAVADLMPWAMLGDVIDEDELATHERREGLYVGFFMFLRKLGGATAVLLVGLVLDLAGYDGTLPREQLPDSALFAVRALTSLAPMAFLLLAIVAAIGYPLTRAAHRNVLEQLSARAQSH